MILVCVPAVDGSRTERTGRTEQRPWVGGVFPGEPPPTHPRNMGNQRAGRLTLFIGGANPPDERKEGVANGYIF